MSKSYVFPGQGAQKPGMGKDLYESNARAKELFEKANEILGYRITDIMFEGSEDDLKQTKVTQPAVFLHSVITAFCMEDFKPDMVAGHSLGEFSALHIVGNPLTETSYAELTLKEAEFVTMEVYSMAGNLVYSKDFGCLEAGLQHLEIGNLSNSVKQGLYLIKVKTSMETHVAKIIQR